MSLMVNCQWLGVNVGVENFQPDCTIQFRVRRGRG